MVVDCVCVVSGGVVYGGECSECTVLAVTHSTDRLGNIRKRALILRDGTVVTAGELKASLLSPGDIDVQLLLSYLSKYPVGLVGYSDVCDWLS